MRCGRDFTRGRGSYRRRVSRSGAGATGTTRSSDSNVRELGVDESDLDVLDGHAELEPDETLRVDGVDDGTTVFRTFDPESGDPVGPEVEVTVDCGAN